MIAAQIVLAVCGGYLALGAVWATVFVVALVGRVDSAAAGAPWTFRLVIWPGCVALWPVVAGWVLRRGRGGAA
ncbi:MAG: hypothetical protein JNJ48_07855 [Phycisphaerae bacterium]|nr:hypothetical protein [Phycisphaerae bacterium]